MNTYLKILTGYNTLVFSVDRFYRAPELGALTPHYVRVIFLLVLLFLLRSFFILFPSTFIVFNYVPELVKLLLLTMGTLERVTTAFP